jgi:two-component system sensor histidine kinase UhpB
MSGNNKNILIWLRIAFYGLNILILLFNILQTSQIESYFFILLFFVTCIIALFEYIISKIFKLYSVSEKNSKYSPQHIIDIQNKFEKKDSDFTDRENELSNAEIIFNRFWEISVDGMRMTDDSGQVIAANEAFCKIMELERNQIVGQPFSIAYHENQRQEAISNYQKNLRNNALKTHFQRERLLWNGKKVWLEFSNSLLELPGYSKIVLSVINDITQRKLSELKVQNSEKRFRTLFNNADDAVFVNKFTRDLRLGIFTEVNNLACYRLGYARDEFLSLNPYVIFPKRYYPIVDAACAELAKTGHTIFEAMQIKKDRSQIPVEVKSHLFELDGHPSILSIARDITDRKLAEKRLNVTSQRLRNLASRLQTIREEERTVIAREIHDELGQSLTVLKIQTALLLNKLKLNQPDVKEKSDSIIELIDQTVESVQKISAKLRPGILDELGLVPAIEWQSQEFQNRTGIHCDCILPKIDIDISADRATAIFRILQESLTNVARHSDAKRVSVILKQVDHTLTLEVTDNGQGITLGQRNDSNSLGLLGMKERALVFGGQVKIHGVSGQGTNVKVEMPLDIDGNTQLNKNGKLKEWK